jgi:poly(hydroxyalkanoate) depolymerase family esterase
MAGLERTFSDLARSRRHWSRLHTTADARPGGRRSDRTRRIGEVAEFGSNPGNLRMLKYVPDAAPPKPALVVVLHGCAQTAAGYDHGAGWSALADRCGFALLLPEQQRANNAKCCFNWFDPRRGRRDMGEALSIRQMIERMVADHNIDRGRIFVTGLSAGGAMASVMLAAYPEVFAGGAIIAGLPYGAAKNVQEALDAMFKGRSRSGKAWGDLVRKASPHKGPWPRISVWHGGVDRTVKPSNAVEIVKQWADLHGLAGRPALESKGPGFTRRVWRNRSGRELIESFTIAGMGHGTPLDAGDGGGIPGPFLLDVGISSTYHVAKFWGLVDEGLIVHEELPPVSPGEDRQGRKGMGLGAYIHAAITKALRAAGLIRP